MGKALFLMIAVGLAIGLYWPGGEAPAPAVVATATGEVRETVLERSEMGHFYANAEVNGELVRFLVDTGATGIALTEKDAQRLGIPFSRSKYAVVGTGASGPVRGQRVKLDKISLDGKEARGLEAVILEGSDLSLLGQSFLGRFSVEMRGGTMRIG